MDIEKVLHNLSHLKWLFLVAQIALILYSFIVIPDNLITIISIIIFITGIYLGFDSLSSVEKMSAKQIELFNTSNLAAFHIKIVLVAIIFLVIISTTFMLLKFVFPAKSSVIFNDFFELGLNCWALILGLICLLKSIGDKDHFARTQKQQLE